MPKHLPSVRVQPLFVSRRSFVIRATQASQDPLHYFGPTQGFDCTENFLRAFERYAATPRLGQQVVMHTEDLADVLTRRQAERTLGERADPPFSTEAWMMCELAGLQRTRHYRPFLPDHPNFFFIGEDVFTVMLARQTARYTADVYDKKKLPAFSRLFWPQRRH